MIYDLITAKEVESHVDQFVFPELQVPGAAFQLSELCKCLFLPGSRYFEGQQFVVALRNEPTILKRCLNLKDGEIIHERIDGIRNPSPFGNSNIYLWKSTFWSNENGDLCIPHLVDLQSNGEWGYAISILGSGWNSNSLLWLYPENEMLPIVRQH